jgi:outer membrane immunogenic protein
MRRGICSVSASEKRVVGDVMKVWLSAFVIAVSTLLFIPANAKANGYGYGPSWTGFYIGAHLGGKWGDYDLRGDDGAFDEAGSETISLEPEAFIGGFQLGYNIQTNGIVIGIEGDVSFGDASESFTVIPSPDNFARAELGTTGTLTARLGFANGSLLTYIKGGAAWSKLSARGGDLIDGTPNPDATDTTTVSKTLTGWTIGGGLEYAMTPNWSLKGEYLFMDFGSVSSTNDDGDSFDHEVEVHTFRVGLNYKFGYARESLK